MPADRTLKSTPSHSARPSQDPARPEAVKAGSKVHKTYHTGDFTITVSDGTLFRVPSYHMFSAGTVLRDAHTVSTNGNLQLDLDVGSNSVELWLDIIVTRKTSRVADFNFWSTIPEAVTLCDKFDCPGVKENILSGLEAVIESQPNKVCNHMGATAALGEARLFEKCIRGTGNEISFSKTATDALPAPLNCLSGTKPIRDLSTWSLNTFRRLPIEYILSTIRSYSLNAESAGDQADEVKKLLAAIDSSKSASASATTSADK